MAQPVSELARDVEGARVDSVEQTAVGQSCHGDSKQADEQDVDAAAQQDASEDAEQVDDAELNAEAAVEASLDAELDAELGKLPDSASVGDGAASIAVAARCSAEAALVAKQAMRDIHSLKVDVIERALVEAVEKARVNSATALNHSMLKQAKDYNRLAEKMANAAGREAARGACGEFKSALEAASGKIDRIHNAASLSVERNMGDKLDALAALVVKSLDAQPAAQPAATTHFDVEALHSKIEERLQASDHRVNDMLEMLKIVVDRVDAVHAQLQAVEAQRANAPTVAAPIAGPPPDDVPVEEDVGEADEEDEGEDDAPASTCCLDKADKAEEAEAAAGVGVAAAGDGVSGAAGEDASKDLDEQECKKGHDCDACHGDGEQAEDTEAAAKGSVGAFVVEAGANELTVVDSVVVRQRENFLKTQLAATSIFA